jgi:choline-sulfatase
MADQLRFDVVGPGTPHIQSLMREGVNFSRAYCAAPLCAPSRASFFTGLSPNRTGSMINPWEEEDESYGYTKANTPNLYSLLENKWDSWHVGKQHFFTQDNIDSPTSKTHWITQQDYQQWMKQQKKSKPGGREFKALVPEMVSGTRTHLRRYSIPVVSEYKEGNDYFLDHYIANESIRAIKQRDKSKPLLLNTMFLAPHPPFDIPEPYFSMVPLTDVKMPENVGVWYPQQSPLQMYNISGFLGARYSREEWQNIWAKYLGLVKLLDDEIGRIIAALKEEGLYDQSLIIFTADHGEMLGSHSLWQKMCMYEESAKVPLIVKFPTDFPMVSKDIATPVSLTDVFPTLLEFTGLPTIVDLDGSSLLPMIQGKKAEDRPVFIQYDGNGSLGNFQRSVVQGNYKLIVDLFKDEVFLELYDVVNDRQETTNLAFQENHAATTCQLLETLRTYMQTKKDRLSLAPNAYERFIKDYKTIVK